MPVVIGAKPESTFADPIGLLTDCHRRIEHFLSVLIRVTEGARGGPLENEQRKALETALRYFREAAPRHTADEEQSLFPRLRRSDRPEVHEMLARVESLEQDHIRADARHAGVDQLGRDWLASGQLSTSDAARLSTLLQELADLYRGHIAVEECELFPVAAQSLTPAERQAMGGEMAARRGLSR